MRTLALLVSVLFFSSNLLNAQDAIYKIEFISNWSSTTHPTDYPSTSAHWSSLIGATHKDAGPLFEVGQEATNGVEQVAETGGTSIITQEINTLIAADLAYEMINGSGLGSGPGTITINNVDVDADFPFLSLITMIAPSPDWVAMIANEKLTDSNNDWLPSISIDVYATDAGTDGGITYTSSNANTSPRDPISSLQNTLPFSDQIIGTFEITLQSVLAVTENELATTFSVYPNPSNGNVIIKNQGNIILESVELYSVNGKRLQSYTFKNQNDLQLNSLAGGLYFLKLNSKKGSLTKKLLIQ